MAAEADNHHTVISTAIAGGRSLLDSALLVADKEDASNWQTSRTRWLRQVSRALHDHLTPEVAAEFLHACRARPQGQGAARHAAQVRGVERGIEMLAALDQH